MKKLSLLNLASFFLLAPMGFGQLGVLNPRNYGAVSNGSTDNSAAFAATFAVANTYTAKTGVPTVFIDCGFESLVCQYNYGGSGAASPINPTVAMNIECAPGVVLKYTGSGHAVDLGASGRTFQDEMPYRIQGCTFTGGESSTHGIFVRRFITHSYVEHNTFLNFGNRSGYNITYEGNNWEPFVRFNKWYDDDGVTRNILDAHAGAVVAPQIVGNNVECENASHQACSVTTIGVGFWIGQETLLENNIIQYHAPLVRISNTSSGSGDRVKIVNNHFEGNYNVAIPAITYGDPGAPGASVGCMLFSGNDLFYPLAAGVPMIGPEVASSGTHNLDRTPFLNNTWSPMPNALYVNTNGGVNNTWGANTVGGASITAASTAPSVFDNNSFQMFAVSAKQNHGGPLTGLPTFLPNGQDLTAGNFHTVSATQLCSNTVTSGTAQACVTSPHFDFDGNWINPVVGDMLIYVTNTANAGDLTIQVNDLGPIHVRKNRGTSVLAAGDIKANVPTMMLFDGTYWQIP